MNFTNPIQWGPSIQIPNPYSASTITGRSRTLTYSLSFSFMSSNNQTVFGDEVVWDQYSNPPGWTTIPATVINNNSQPASQNGTLAFGFGYKGSALKTSTNPPYVINEFNSQNILTAEVSVGMINNNLGYQLPSGGDGISYIAVNTGSEETVMVNLIPKNFIAGQNYSHQISGTLTISVDLTEVRAVSYYLDPLIPDSNNFPPTTETWFECINQIVVSASASIDNEAPFNISQTSTFLADEKLNQLVPIYSLGLIAECYALESCKLPLTFPGIYGNQISNTMNIVLSQQFGGTKDQGFFTLENNLNDQFGSRDPYISAQGNSITLYSITGILSDESLTPFVGMGSLNRPLLVMQENTTLNDIFGGNTDNPSFSSNFLNMSWNIELACNLAGKISGFDESFSNFPLPLSVLDGNNSYTTNSDGSFDETEYFQKYEINVAKVNELSVPPVPLTNPLQINFLEQLAGKISAQIDPKVLSLINQNPNENLIRISTASFPCLTLSHDQIFTPSCTIENVSNCTVSPPDQNGIVSVIVGTGSTGEIKLTYGINPIIDYRYMSLEISSHLNSGLQLLLTINKYSTLPYLVPKQYSIVTGPIDTLNSNSVDLCNPNINQSYIYYYEQFPFGNLNQNYDVQTSRFTDAPNLDESLNQYAGEGPHWGINSPLNTISISNLPPNEIIKIKIPNFYVKSTDKIDFITSNLVAEDFDSHNNPILIRTGFCCQVDGKQSLEMPWALRMLGNNQFTQIPINYNGVTTDVSLGANSYPNTWQNLTIRDLCQLISQRNSWEATPIVTNDTWLNSDRYACYLEEMHYNPISNSMENTLGTNLTSGTQTFYATESFNVISIYPGMGNFETGIYGTAIIRFRKILGSQAFGIAYTGGSRTASGLPITFVTGILEENLHVAGMDITTVDGNFRLKGDGGLVQGLNLFNASSTIQTCLAQNIDLNPTLQTSSDGCFYGLDYYQSYHMLPRRRYRICFRGGPQVISSVVTFQVDKSGKGLRLISTNSNILQYERSDGKPFALETITPLFQGQNLTGKKDMLGEYHLIYDLNNDIYYRFTKNSVWSNPILLLTNYTNPKLILYSFSRGVLFAIQSGILYSFLVGRNSALNNSLEIIGPKTYVSQSDISTPDCQILSGGCLELSFINNNQLQTFFSFDGGLTWRNK